MKRLEGVRPRTILVISYGGIGDIFLTTPLIASLKNGFPEARIDVYVQQGRQAILEGNPDIASVFVTRHRRGVRSYLDFVRSFGGRYDLAVSVRTSDRQTLFARVAGRRAIGLLPQHGQGSFWKRLLLSGWARAGNVHAVDDVLRLADVLGLARTTQCWIPRDSASPDRLDALLPFAWLSDAFALLQVFPRNPYKEWTLEGWQRLVEDLLRRRLRVVVLGGPERNEVEYVADLVRRVSSSRVFNIAGKTSFADAAELLRQCRLYVGLDTAVTHLAAVVKAPTLALFGLPRARHYFPYHEDLLSSGIETVAPRLEKSGPVWVVRGACPCTGRPTQCELQPGLEALCMRSIDSDRVVELVGRAIDGGVAG